jgi:hypothetical protein
LWLSSASRVTRARVSPYIAGRPCYQHQFREQRGDQVLGRQRSRRERCPEARVGSHKHGSYATPANPRQNVAYSSRRSSRGRVSEGRLIYRASNSASAHYPPTTSMSPFEGARPPNGAWPGSAGPAKGILARSDGVQDLVPRAVAYAGCLDESQLTIRRRHNRPEPLRTVGEQNEKLLHRSPPANHRHDDRPTPGAAKPVKHGMDQHYSMRTYSSAASRTAVQPYEIASKIVFRAMLQSGTPRRKHSLELSQGKRRRVQRGNGLRHVDDHRHARPRNQPIIVKAIYPRLAMMLTMAMTATTRSDLMALVPFRLPSPMARKIRMGPSVGFGKYPRWTAGSAAEM